jgi:hypothetical protein
MVNERVVTVSPSSTARTGNAKMPAAIIVQTSYRQRAGEAALGIQVFARIVA